MVSTVSRALTLAIALALAAGAARADAPGPPIATDQLSTRSLAMGAMRGLAAGTDAIWLNPGAIAARRRYAAELQWQLDQHTADGNATFYGASVVDAQTSSMAGGFAYNRVDVPGASGNRWNLALAGQVAKGLFVGVSGEYLILYGPEDVKTGNVHAGLLWELADIVSIGLAGTNLIPTGHSNLEPTGAAAGIAVGNDKLFHVAADWLVQWDASGKKHNTWATGAEVLIGDLVPVRAGLTKDEWRGGQWWSAGAGVVTSSGVALDLAYRQAIHGDNNRVFAAGLKIFLFN